MKKVISIAVIIVGALLIIGGVAPMVIGTILQAQIPSASVGIIGGADGPTAIMVTGVSGTGNAAVEIIVGLLLIVAGIGGCCRRKK